MMASMTLQHKYLPIANGHLLLVILLGYAIRLYGLGVQSLWYDELVSAFLANLPSLELVAHTARDIHPPGYYLLLHYWTTALGDGEVALALLSVIFGILLIPTTYALAAYLSDRTVASWAAFLIAISPFNLWYSQEVRMYTLGAVLGVLAVYLAVRAFSAGTKMLRRRLWLGYVIVAALGLYTLYYFGFLLLAINLLLVIHAVYPKYRPDSLKPLIFANVLVLIIYSPWIPTAWRQISNPPVPPWRSPPQFWSIALESWTALSLGQSVEYAAVWPILLVSLALFILGIRYLSMVRAASPISPAPLLVVYTFVPLLTIYLASFITPLYHVRYLFTYSPAFYILMGAGLVWLATRRYRLVTLALICLLSIASLYSIYRFHFNPRYRTDDFRAAVDFVQTRWQPGDIILTNAGYTYPAFYYYADQPDLERTRLVPYPQHSSNVEHPLILQAGTIKGDPQLGWGDPRSDFYAMSEAETITSLEQLSRDYARLWVLRAYDTVTDPDALIRSWLAEHTVPIEDQRISGTSNIRAQGFLLKGQPNPADHSVLFEDGMVLQSWQMKDKAWEVGQTMPVKLWWSTTARPQADYKMSLKLWSPEGQLAAQGQDDWPGGTLYRAMSWPEGDTVYHPAKITLPADVPPGQYWLNVELYHPETIQPLHRVDTGESAVTLGPVLIAPTETEIPRPMHSFGSD